MLSDFLLSEYSNSLPFILLPGHGCTLQDCIRGPGNVRLHFTDGKETFEDMSTHWVVRHCRPPSQVELH